MGAGRRRKREGKRTEQSARATHKLAHISLSFSVSMVCLFFCAHTLTHSLAGDAHICDTCNRSVYKENVHLSYPLARPRTVLLFVIYIFLIILYLFYVFCFSLFADSEQQGDIQHARFLSRRLDFPPAFSCVLQRQ